MQMESGLDTGPMLQSKSCPITALTTAESLHDELMIIGAELIVPTLDELAAGRLYPTKQPSEGVTYASKLTRDDGRVDWQWSASDIERQIRGLKPWPGCFFTVAGEPIKILSAHIIDKQGIPGTILNENFTIACGQKALQLDMVQRAGKNTTDGASFLRGSRLPLGTIL